MGHLTLHHNASRFLRGSIAVAIVALGAAAYRLLSTVRYRRTAVRRRVWISARRGGLAEMIGGGGFFMHRFATLGLIRYNGKFHD
jgi:hypothetical protein